MVEIARKIQVSHLPEGHGIDRALLQNLIEKYYDRLNTRLPGEMFMEVHFKEAHTGGKREQVEVHAKAVIAGINLHARHIEWDAKKALTASMKALEKEAEKVLHKK